MGREGMTGGAGGGGAAEARSCLPPLDAAVRFARGQAAWLLPMYVLAMGPFAAAVWLAIDAVTAQDRAALALPCLLLVPATLWRWVGLSAMQRRVLAQLRAQPVRPLWPRLGGVLTARLGAHLLVTWGGLLLVLPFWGLFIGGFATPAVLEQDRRATAAVVEVLRWINRSVGYLGRLSAVLCLLAMLLVLAVAGVQLALAFTVLPSLLGIDAADLRLTMASLGWALCSGFLVFMVFDLYWTVAAVLVLDHLRMRRTGSDLAARLATLEAGA